MNDISRRVLEGIVAAFFGGFVVAFAQFLYRDSVTWHFVYFAAFLCGIIGFFVGQRFLDWLGELFSRI